MKRTTDLKHDRILQANSCHEPQHELDLGSPDSSHSALAAKSINCCPRTALKNQRQHGTRPPACRALLLGARVPDLHGVDHDIELMREALEQHGFTDIRVVIPATRDAMQMAIAELIEDTEAGDAVVLYYSGHGSTLEAQHVDGAEPSLFGETSTYRFLVPSDIEESSDEDFRGYTNIELSEDLATLTTKSRNVVAIVDCCYAGRVFRRSDDEREIIDWQDLDKGPPVRNVVLDGRLARAAARHYDRLRESTRVQVTLHAEANPWVVQLLASASHEPAFETLVPERSVEDSYYAGTMTVALHAALMRINPDLTTWQDLGRMIYETPQRGRSQRITVTGPYRRFLFSEHERAPHGELSLRLENGSIQVNGGRLADLSEGDIVELFSFERTAFVAVGTAELCTVRSTLAELGPFPDSVRVAPDSYARPLHYTTPRAVLEIAGISGPARVLLEARLAGNGLLRMIDAGETYGELPVAGQLRANEAGRIVLAAPNLGEYLSLDIPRTLDPTDSPHTAAVLAEHLSESARRLARAAILRALPEPSATERLAPAWDLHVYTIESERLGRQLKGGEHLANDRITVDLMSSSEDLLYCNVLLVRADGQIRLLSQGQGGSIELPPGHSYRLGQRSRDPTDRVRGVELERPNLPNIRSGAIEVMLIIALSDAPVDLRSWEQDSVLHFSPRDPFSPSSTERNLRAPPKCSVAARYHLERFTFCYE